MRDGAPERKNAFIPALVTFVLVTGAVLIGGFIATWFLQRVLLPILAVLLGLGAARVVYKIRD